MSTSTVIRPIDFAPIVPAPSAYAWRPALWLCLSDALALSIVYWCAVWLKFLEDPARMSPSLYLEIYPLLLLTLGAFLFEQIYPGLFLHPAEEMKRIVHSTTKIFLMCLAFSFLWKNTDRFSRSVLLITWLAGTVAVILARQLVRSLCCDKAWWKIPAVVLGTGPSAQRLLRKIEQSACGIRITGVLSEARQTEWDSSLPPVIGDLSFAPLVVAMGAARYAIVVMPDKTAAELTALMQQHCRHFRHVLLVPELPQTCSIGILSRDLAGDVGLEIPQRLSFPFIRVCKRLVDITVSFASLIVLSPLFLGIALLVKITSRGTIFFSHKRQGREGKVFRAWKFRSLVTDANRVLDEYLMSNPEAMREWSEFHKLRKDPRVTLVGGLLRRFSLDELPQLFNVLMGQMSLVGPRPIVEQEIERYADGYNLYLQVTPGMTGLWQVSGRNNTTYEERVAFDRYYVRNWSIWLDLYILARTFRAVLRSEGAY